MGHQKCIRTYDAPCRATSVFREKKKYGAFCTSDAFPGCLPCTIAGHLSGNIGHSGDFHFGPLLTLSPHHSAMVGVDRKRLKLRKKNSRSE